MLYIRYGALLIKTAIHTIIKVMEHSQETQEKHKRTPQDFKSR